VTHITRANDPAGGPGRLARPALGLFRQGEAPDTEVLERVGADDQPDRLTDPISQLLRVVRSSEAEFDGNEDGRPFHVADDIQRMVH
jgi:hypothetical protein